MSRIRRVQVPGVVPQADPEGPGVGLDLDAVGEVEDDSRDQAPPAEQEVQSTESDIDAALEAGAAGGTHRIVKPKPEVGPARLPRPDPTRTQSAAVNQAPAMSYDEAMDALARGELKRSTLTERGWVAVAQEPPPENKR